MKWLATPSDQVWVFSRQQLEEVLRDVRREVGFARFRETAMRFALSCVGDVLAAQPAAAHPDVLEAYEVAQACLEAGFTARTMDESARVSRSLLFCLGVGREFYPALNVSNPRSAALSALDLLGTVLPQRIGPCQDLARHRL